MDHHLVAGIPSRTVIGGKTGKGKSSPMRFSLLKVTRDVYIKCTYRCCSWNMEEEPEPFVRSLEWKLEKMLAPKGPVMMGLPPPRPNSPLLAGPVGVVTFDDDAEPDKRNSAADDGLGAVTVRFPPVALLPPLPMPRLVPRRLFWVLLLPLPSESDPELEPYKEEVTEVVVCGEVPEGDVEPDGVRCPPIMPFPPVLRKDGEVFPLPPADPCCGGDKCS